MNIDLYHGTAANLLCVDGKVNDNLQLNWNYAPLGANLDRFDLKVEHPYILFKGGDPEYSLLEGFLQTRESSILKDRFYPLNLPNTPANVSFRQEGVKELVSNVDLYHSIEDILKENPFKPYWVGMNYDEKGEVTPEQVKKFLKNIHALEVHHPQSGPLLRLMGWADELNQDTFFQELLRKKRSIKDRRIFLSANSRYGGTEVYLLKSGVKLEDVFDRIDPLASAYDYTSEGKRPKEVHRSVVKYRTGDDQELVEQVIGQMTAQVNVVNEISARMLGMPIFLTYMQLKHLYVGAYLHKELSSQYPLTFPEVHPDSSLLDAEGVLPIRLVLESMVPGLRSRIKDPLVSNSFKFGEHEVVQIEGSNGAGKSEAWRTLHWLNLLVNSGYSLPADNVRCGVIPNSHFISCKGNSAHGGSELELSLRGIQRSLGKVSAGDQVILDELGDSANAPTALEFGKRIIPVLVSRGCRVLITTQHSALSDYIREDLNGLTLTPDKAYKLELSNGQVDFKPGEVLDRLGATSKKLAELISPVSHPYAQIEIPVSRADREQRSFLDDPEEDFPF